MEFVNQLKQNDSVQFVQKMSSWQDAIKLCFEPLLQNQSITSGYVAHAIQSGQDLNFYYLIAPGLAMPHTRPEYGVEKNGISLLIVKEGVEFESHEFNPIYCLIGLAALDNDKHIELMENIVDIFGGHEDVVDNLRKFSEKSQVIDYLTKLS
ncbi:MAG: PTS sugar transporter subunit IIA [Brevinemataceae bacterium]